MTDVYILNKPGMYVPGSTGDDASGHMVYTASKDAKTISVGLIDALARLADTLGDGLTASDAGGHFTCGEAQDIADVLAAAGHTDAADAWLKGHAQGDNDPEDMHHDLREVTHG